MASIPSFIHAARVRWSEPGRPRPHDVVVPQPGQESVWDYPRPPRVERVKERVSIEFAGLLIADTENALRVLETSHPPNYYIPFSDIRFDCLNRAGGSSICEWKGRAQYWTVAVGSREADTAAWSYPDPFDDFAVLRYHMAFYAAPMDACRVGPHLVTPQPGAFYGGWVTPNIVGPFKGSPGSSGW